MGLISKIRGEFIDIIQWLDDSPDTLLYRFERYENEIKYGAQLVVRESQVAVFVNEGQIADVYSPGTYTLETKNMPILTTLKGWKYGFHSPFKVEVYFANTRQFTDRKWGTSNPIMMRDPEFGPIRLRAFGNYALRVKDPAELIRQVAGTDSRFSTEEITEQLKNIIITRFSDLLAESGIPAIDLATQYDELSATVEKKIADEFTEYGIELTKFLVENISFPPEVEEAIDKRNSMGVIGNLDRYMQYQSANAMQSAAENPGGAAGEGIGLGMGFAMANQMVKGFPQQGGGAQETPPPIPGEARVYLAIKGERKGPFTQAELQAQIHSGEFTPETLVWKTGMENWRKAAEVPEIARLFSSVPSPIPESEPQK